MSAMKQSDVRTSIRLPKSLHNAVVEISERDHRSFNAQVIAMIEEYLRNHPAPVTPVTPER